MHGLIFVSLRDYLSAEHGAATEQEVMAGDPQYFVSEGYLDERFTRILERACRSTGMPPDELLREFGTFTAEKTFARLYPALFALSESARSFLLTVETRIHEVVRVAIPDALPPELDVSERGDDAVSIVYTSRRRLCPMLRGLVEGTARHFGEAVSIEEPRCMLRGDEQCRLEVRFTRATTAASPY
jgi:predicted hydrocarbon binding protein